MAMHVTKESRPWLAKSSRGRNPIFDDSEDLLEASFEYLEWCNLNPLHETKPFHYQGVVELKEIPLPRVTTLMGLCMFLDISQCTWGVYRKKDDFTKVCSCIEDAIRNNKFSGAAVNLYNASIIARDLGLVDKQEVDLGNKNNTPFRTQTIADVEKALKERGIPVPVLNVEDMLCEGEGDSCDDCAEAPLCASKVEKENVADELCEDRDSCNDCPDLGDCVEVGEDA